MNLPLIDYHVHLTQEFTIDLAVKLSTELNVKFGIVEHPGAQTGIQSDDELLRYIENLRKYPVYVGLQPVYRNWSDGFSQKVLDQLDYVLMDADTVPLGNHTYLEIWRHNNYIEDVPTFMELYMNHIENILKYEPLTIFARPTYLPVNFGRYYDALWTGDRVQKIIQLAKERNIGGRPTGGKRHAPKTAEVTRNRLKRMALTLQFPGGVSQRSVEECLRIAFDEGRSPAYLSQLLHEAGKRAGEILEQVDHSALGQALQARDELFVHHRDPILLMVEPHSLVITGLYATPDREAETWGCVLLLTQDRKVKIRGLAEDNCIPYGASCKLARLDAAIQKDVWHPLEDVRKVIKDIDRDAWHKMASAEKLEKRLNKGWVEADFSELVKLSLEIDDLLAQNDRLRFWLSCLWDAVELVDWRSGEIRNLEINQWLALESLKAMKKLSYPRIQKLVERLEGVIPEMLTFLDGIALPLAEWQAQALEHFQNPGSVAYFQSRVARLWRMEHARRHDQYLRDQHPHARSQKRDYYRGKKCRPEIYIWDQCQEF